jgi:two-component system response regulator PilR (NtrC family)
MTMATASSSTAASAPGAAYILVVDDEPDLRTLYELTLLREGYRVETAGTVQEATQQLQERRFDAVITDMRLPDGVGLELLHRLRAQQRNERCVVMTAYGSAENAVEALKAGAFDYLTKPVDLKQFRTVVASAIQATGTATKPGKAGTRASGTANTTSTGAAVPPERQASGTSALDRLVGNSEAMQSVKQRIAKVARSMAPVLIRGESGTGKELVAQALHANSHRADGPWVAVNCGAIPENLLESELFGHEKGSFTSAVAQRKGKFELAEGGTLFLDEIGDMSLSAQAKVLRALQENKITRVGGDKEIKVNVRVVAATNKDLEKEIEKETFRRDLFHRLNVIPIKVPSLDERKEDIPLLADYFLDLICEEMGIAKKSISSEALKSLQARNWHGNIREFRNVIERLIILGGKEISEADVKAYG